MITEIVMFRLPEGMSRDDALAKYRLSIPIWQANPDLIRKAFLFDEASRQGGGVYLWRNVRSGQACARCGFSRTDPVHLWSKP